MYLSDFRGSFIVCCGPYILLRVLFRDFHIVLHFDAFFYNPISPLTLVGCNKGLKWLLAADNHLELQPYLLPALLNFIAIQAHKPPSKLQATSLEATLVRNCPAGDPPTDRSKV